MSKKSVDIAHYEKAISEKYGEESVTNPRSSWDDEKEAQYLEQMKKVYQREKRRKDKEVKEKHEALNKRDLFREQSALINTINKTLSNKLYRNFVPNFKTIASVYSIFQEELPIKDRVLLEEKIINQMSSSVVTKQETQQPIDSIVYGTFVKSFNEEYSDSLSENQKELLGQYVSSFADNGLGLKIFVNEEIPKLKQSLKNLKKSSDNEIVVQKIDKVYSMLESTKEKKLDKETIEIILHTQQLVKEIEEHDD